MQEQAKIYNAAITIESVEVKDNQYKLLSHDGKKYGFWAVKKDGQDSAPFAQFKTMGLKKGDTVRIGYVVEEFDTQHGRKQANKIINFQETNESPSTASPNPQQAITSQNQQSPRTGDSRPQPGASNDQFGRRLALHGFVNALLSNGATIETVVADLPALLKLEDEIDNHLNPPTGWAKAQASYRKEEELPTIQVNDELPPIEAYDEPPLSNSEVDGIPF